MLAGLQASSLLCQINIPSPAHTSCLEMMGYQLGPHPYSCPHSASRRKRCTQQNMCFALRKYHSIKDKEILGLFALYLLAGTRVTHVHQAQLILSALRGEQWTRFVKILGSKTEQGLHKSQTHWNQAQNSLLACFQISVFEHGSQCFPIALFLA